VLTNFQPEEFPGRDADDRERQALDDQRFADRVRVPCKPPLPEEVADHDDRAIHPAPSHIVRSREHPSVLCRNSQRLEKISTDEQTGDNVGLRPLAERQRFGHPRQCTIERIGPRLQPLPHRMIPTGT
jgi:hypothetical protein